MKKSLPQISILAAIDMLATSWDMVTKTTIVNCFAKAGLSANMQGKALQGKAQESARDFLNVDDQIIATATLQPEEEIFAELRDKELKDS